MKVEIWSDFVCPYCYIGQKSFQEALSQFKYKEHITVQYKCFQLDPEASVQNEKTVVELLMDTFSLQEEEVKEKISSISEMAKQVNAHIQLEKLHHTNSYEAHRLVKLASTIGKEQKLVNQIFETYFSQYENIGSREVLIKIAQEAGLQLSAVENLFDCRKYHNALREDLLVAEEIGIEGVPFFVFNEVHAISGAHHSDVFLQILEQLWEEEHPNNLSVPNEAPVCTTTYCDGENCYTKNE